MSALRVGSDTIIAALLKAKGIPLAVTIKHHRRGRNPAFLYENKIIVS